MKQLHEYETPITDKATCGITDIFGAYSELTNPKTSRELERKLAMCRDALDFIRRNVWEQGGIIAKAATEALDQTK